MFNLVEISLGSFSALNTLSRCPVLCKWFDCIEVFEHVCMIDQHTQMSHYSQLLPCGHLAITDITLMRTAAKSLVKITDT